MSINRQHIVDALYDKLRALSLINDDEDIINIDFGQLTGTVVPIKLSFKRQAEVQVIKYE